MSEVYEIGETVVTTSEYTEILTLIHSELLSQTEYLAGLYGMTWVLAGMIVGAITLYAFYKMFTV